MEGFRQKVWIEWIVQRMRDGNTVRRRRRRDVDGWGTEGISKQTGRWGGWVERYNDCRSAGNDKESERERWTHNRALPLLYQITVVPPFISLPPLPCVAYPLFSVYVGLIEAFRHRIKASGNVPLRRRLEAACPNAKNKVKQSSSKRPSSRRRGFLRFQHQQRTFWVFHC